MTQRKDVPRTGDELILDATDSPLSFDPATVPPDELERAVRRLVLLYSLGRQVTAEVEVGGVFRAILAATSELLSLERAFVAVLDAGELRARASHGIDVSGPLDDWPVSRTMLRRVLADGVAILTTDALRDGRFEKVPSVDLHNIRSAMCCPLGHPRSPRGLLYVDNRGWAGAFSRSDLEFLTALGHYGSLALRNAEARGHLERERDLAEARLGGSQGRADAFVHRSRSMHALDEMLRRVARKDVPVLLVGETGTGKEILARRLHEHSPRKGAFVALNVGALAEGVVESELFGHEKGAFTGADRRRLGRFELADGGTLFLDEILDAPPHVQVRLLRVLEQHTFERVGGTETLAADVRIVCACNADPEQAVRDQSFRQDLLFRINAVTLAVPPLRARPEDVAPLVAHFLGAIRSGKTFAPEALDGLAGYAWPGNVRELRNCIEALDALVEGEVIARMDLPERMRRPGAAAAAPFEPLPALLERVEHAHMKKALEQANGVHERAIELLGISRSKYYERKKQRRD